MTDYYNSDAPEWRHVLNTIERIVRDDIANGALDPDETGDYAHEWADGAEWVIYTWQARTLWAGDSRVQGFEDEASDFGPFETVDAWITATVYAATYAAIVEAVESVAAELTLSLEER